MGFIARIEPSIPTVEGTKIPDLCAWKDSAYVVYDVAVGSDTADLDKIHFSKVSKYDSPEIHQWMKDNNPVSESQKQKGNVMERSHFWGIMEILEEIRSLEEVPHVDLKQNHAEDV